MKLYVEGGGNGKDLRSECRRGFRTFLEKAGLKGKMPQIVASGSRRKAYEDFCLEIKHGKAAMLLVDSETPIDPAHQQGEPDNWLPWQHLKANPGDRWHKPRGAKDTDCYLMVQCMESWFLADREALRAFFGQNFNDNALPPSTKSLESIAKTEALEALKRASRSCLPKGQYDKGSHSFKLLAQIDPAKVTAASPWAKRLVKLFQKQMSVS